MASSRRTQIVVLFGLTLGLSALAAWVSYGRPANSTGVTDRSTLLLLTLVLLLVLALAGVRLHTERQERRQAEAKWQAQTADLQGRERKRSEELGIAMDALQKRFALSQRVEAALRESEHRVRTQLAELQVLSRRLLEAQETERRRVARELHDEIGQVLTAVKINLQAMQRMADPAEPLPRLQESLDIVDRALQQVRNLSLELRPAMLDDLGLVASLRWYVDRQANRAGLQGQFAAQPADLQVSPELATTCFRIAQEAITNILRHARARKVSVELRQSGPELRLLVRDDGIGFDLAAARRRAAEGGSLGLPGMEERALLLGGRLDIRSAPDQGTEICVRFPLSSDAGRGEPERSAGP